MLHLHSYILIKHSGMTLR